MTKRRVTLGLTVAITLILFARFTSTVNASTSGSFSNITYILVNAEGVFIYTDEVNKPNPAGCTNGNRYVLRHSHPIFNQLYALLLTAYSNNSKIKIWVEDNVCTADSPSVWSIQIKK